MFPLLISYGISYLEQNRRMCKLITVLLFLSCRPYFKWKVLCFEAVMHYFETQPPPWTSRLQLRKQKTEWVTCSLAKKTFLSPTKMLSVVHICHFAKDTNCKDLFTFQIGQIDEWEDSKARLGRGLGTLFHQRETVPSQGTTLNHRTLRTSPLCSSSLLWPLIFLFILRTTKRGFILIIIYTWSVFAFDEKDAIQSGRIKGLIVEEMYHLYHCNKVWWGSGNISKRWDAAVGLRCISLVILDYPHSGPAGKSATLHINCFGRNLPHMRRCNSLSHSFPPTCISDMRAIVCGTDFSTLTF